MRLYSQFDGLNKLKQSAPYFVSKYMKKLHILYPLTIVTIAIFLTASFSPVQSQIPDKFENLKVLPKDITKPELVGRMKKFTAALGLRCVNCHVGDAKIGFSSFDFKSDDKELKVKARFMLGMVEAINSDLLAKLDMFGKERVKVECMTCHRGQSKPILIGDALMTAYDNGGIDTLTAKFRGLRDRYYGTHTYDFGERVLSRIGATLEGLGDMPAVLRVLKMNAEYFLESSTNFAQIAFAYLELADTTSAIENLETAIKLSPNVSWLKMQLEKIKGEAE